MKIKQKQKKQRWRVHNLIILMCLDAASEEFCWVVIHYLVYELWAWVMQLSFVEIWHASTGHSHRRFNTPVLLANLFISKIPNTRQNTGAVVYTTFHTQLWQTRNSNWVSMSQQSHKVISGWRKTLRCLKEPLPHCTQQLMTVSEMHLLLNNYVHVKWVHVHCNTTNCGSYV